MPVQPLRPPRSRDRMLVWLAIIFSTAVMAALFAAWQLQQPLRSLAQAVARFGRGQPTPPVPERGPRELRQLTHGFNQMVREVSQTENDRAIMLAGVAHDLKTPLARLRLRAEMMDDRKCATAWCATSIRWRISSTSFLCSRTMAPTAASRSKSTSSARGLRAAIAR